MKITLKLFATLTDYLPANAKGNIAEMELSDDQSVGELVDTLRLPEKLVHLVLVNGAYVAPEARPTHALTEGDTLAIWPPIAGG
ncbi:MAG: MoaD/ThiS family protein [Rhodocyclaceae bacterium]|nr:MoaD/ThiS family protein [Rhodocyclaceae bacterium]